MELKKYPLFALLLLSGNQVGFASEKPVGQVNYVGFGVSVSAADFAGVGVSLLSPSFWNNQNQVGISYTEQATDSLTAQFKRQEHKFTELGLGLSSRMPVAETIAMSAELALKYARVNSRFANATMTIDEDSNLVFSEFRFGFVLLPSAQQASENWAQIYPEMGWQIRTLHSNKAYAVGDRVIRGFESGAFIGFKFGV